MFLWIEPADFRGAQRFLVGIGSAIAGAFGRFTSVAVGDSALQSRAKVVTGFLNIVQMSQAMANCPIVFARLRFSGAGRRFFAADREAPGPDCSFNANSSATAIAMIDQFSSAKSL